MTDRSPDAAALKTRPDLVRRAEIGVSTAQFDADMRFFIDALGFRLDGIWPADAPAFAALSGHGTAILLERRADAARVLSDQATLPLTALPRSHPLRSRRCTRSPVASASSLYNPQ